MREYLLTRSTAVPRQPKRMAAPAKIFTLCALPALLALAVPPGLAQAATMTQIDTAIENGLANLAATQQPGGYWNYGGYEQAATGAAVGAFVSQEALWGSNAAAYTGIVNNAMNYLLAGATVNTVGTRSDGFSPCPGGTSSCTFFYLYGACE